MGKESLAEVLRETRRGVGRISDDDLLARLGDAGCRERSAAALLVYLGEVDWRRLYLPLGLGSPYQNPPG